MSGVKDLADLSPERKRAAKVHQVLLKRAEEIETGFMELSQAIADAVAIKAWEFYGDIGPDSYFKKHVNLEPRSWRRLEMVWKGIQSLPAKERPEAQKAFAAIGRHKAGVLMPLLVKPADPAQPAIDWKAWITFASADGINERALQDAVSEARGLPPKPAKGADLDADFRDWVLSRLPEAEKQRCTVVWTLWEAKNTDAAGGRRVGFVGSLVMAFDLVQQDLADAGIEVPVTP